jgi:Tol biopolymer transport system component
VTRDPAPKVCAAWSPAGARIAYVALADGGGTLLTIRPDGEDRHPTTFRAKSVTSLCWSPDGRWLLLGLDHGLHASLCLTDLSGTTQPFADGLNGSQFPQWTRKRAALHPLTLADPSASHLDAAPSGGPSLP